ncbi:MAG: hypothetical protein IK062_05600 [Selenomonadaceae bacterium]|nr:hypothetical protein [Selenomonadaceae bacterium]
MTKLLYRQEHNSPETLKLVVKNLINGNFEIEIFLFESDEPLFCIWNGNAENFSNRENLKFYLLDYNQWRMEQSMALQKK